MAGILRMIAALALVALAACGGPPPPAPPDEVSRLAAAIAALGPEVDRDEARRAAEISYAHTHRLAREYKITDPPIIHNTKVNLGIKPRGLCWHWARDMEERLAQERFETLDLHRAVANADNAFRLEHSTAVVSARGAAYDDGIALDPWRKGGRLTWVPVREDRAYKWQPRNEVVARALERKHGQIVTLTDDQRILMGGVEFVPE
jgi:predicted small lipoprotein YifL